MLFGGGLWAARPTLQIRKKACPFGQAFEKEADYTPE